MLWIGVVRAGGPEPAPFHTLRRLRRGHGGGAAPAGTSRAVLRADGYSPTGRPGSRAVMFRFGTWPTGITSTSSRSATSTTETVFEWALAT